jgi:phosphatidylglycerophosphate synthase
MSMSLDGYVARPQQGTSTLGQYLVDDLHIVIVPILLGAGSDTSKLWTALEPTMNTFEVVSSHKVSHIRLTRTR